MKKKHFILILIALLLFPVSAWATNGDNLIAIGPIARSMGGVGIAAPQDAISAVFANPAAMCFGNYCPSSQTDFGGTLFMPKISTSVTSPQGVTTADSEDNVYAIPAIGISAPIGGTASRWRFGLAAYGVSGLGVDYRDTVIDNNNAFGPGAPLVAGAYTNLQIMKFAPSIAYQVSEKWSLGAALHIDYATLDLRGGGSSNYAFGGQFGAIVKPMDALSLGVTYITPQTVDHDRVSDFNGDGTLDTLSLQAPQQAGFGAAVEAFDEKLLLEADVKWINWSGADGYEDFDWDDQTVLALGMQFKPVKNLALRLGYNYAANPVNEHDNFNGTFGSTKTVQGLTMPTYYYETFRIVGFPAIVQHHVTFGIGYDISDRFSVELGYMHGFEETITETGTNLAGQPVTLASTLSENSVDFGLSWQF